MSPHFNAAYALHMNSGWSMDHADISRTAARIKSLTDSGMEMGNAVEKVRRSGAP